MGQKLTISEYNKLEKELNLKELQIRSLLNITQAINNNVSATGLYKMYRDFLSWEMSVEKMALLTREGEKWSCVSSIDVKEDFLTEDLLNLLLQIQRMRAVKEEDGDPLKEFDVVIPVLHKEEPIAYALIGGFNDEKDLYSKVQFITTITNIVAVAIENKRLFNEQLEQKEFQRELELASEVQRWLLPQSFPESHRYEVEFFYKPHFNVGGDYFDFFPIDDNTFYYCIADISGKGVGAALLMANFQAMLKSKLSHADIDMAAVVRDLNRTVYEITLGDKFITFFLAKVDLKKDLITYINAGHNPPIFYHNDDMEFLDAGTTVLGAVPKLPFIELGEKYIEEDTMLLNFTDGLTDLKNEDDEYFSIDHIKDMLCTCTHMRCKDFMRLLKSSLIEFKGSREYPDDIAVLSFKIFKNIVQHKEKKLAAVNT